MMENAAKRRMKKWEERKERSKDTRGDIKEVQEKLDALAEAYKRDDTQHSFEESERLTEFHQLPLTTRTMQGLEKGNYKHMTHIQAEALPHALVGRDILGAAKTGSGKTLCFVLPVLERLHLLRWDDHAGLGALILSPTRELALQIFKVMQVVGVSHRFSAGLLTGGRNIKEEQRRVSSLNIIIGTPGRILHHTTESEDFNVDNLAILAFDEADRLLDMGFRPTITGILDQLPKGGSRQTLLFSATQSRDVKMIGQLCLNEPVYVADHAVTAVPTPVKACQNFMITELHHKMDFLLSFLKRHPGDKTVVFMSTCNQVKFMYLAFSQLLKKMKLPMMCLTGKMKQFRREEVFLTFSRCKAGVLLCTDIAARGLDFPMVHWVIQYDCPESVQTYIHRIGRTARAGAKGAGILLLSESEKAMLSHLHFKNIPMREIRLKQHFHHSEQSKQLMVALTVQTLKYEAQKAFIGYLRSVHFASNKDVFNLQAIDVQKFAQSLGLHEAPNMAELQQGRSAKNLPYDIINFIAESERKQKREEGKRSRSAVDEDDIPASGSDEDDEGGVQQRKDKTRRERKLTAEEIFTRKQAQTERYATKEGAFKQQDGDDGADQMVLKKKARTSSSGAAAATEGDDSGAPAALTAEERLAGLSKKKQRALVKNADLKVKDLGLSTHQKFNADDIEEEDSDDAAVKRKKQKSPATTVAAKIGVRREVVSDDDDTGSSSGAEEDYAATVRKRLAAVASDDKQKFKDVRRQRDLRKKERLMGSSGGGEQGGGGGVTLGRPSDDDEEDDDDDASFNSDDESEDEDDYDELLQAAEGLEGADDDENDDEDEEEEEEEELRAVPPKRRRKQ